MRYLMISVFSFQLCEPPVLRPLPVGEGHGCLVLPEGGVDIGHVARGERVTFTVPLSNPCDGPIGIVSAVLVPSDSRKVGLTGTELLGRVNLGPGQATEVPFAFMPPAFGDFEATVELQTTDRPTVLPTLTFRATTDGPEPVATPSTVEFGEVQVGCDRSLDLDLVNRGTAPLYVTIAGLDPAYVVESRAGDTAPWILEPAPSGGDTPVLPLNVTFSPRKIAAPNSTLTWASDDGYSGPTEIWLRGNGVVGAKRTETRVIDAKDKAHLLLVADRSEGMQDALDMIAIQSRALFATLDGGNLDWRVSVLSADDGCVIGPDLWIEPGGDPEAQAAQFAQMLDADGLASPSTSLARQGFQIVQNALSAKNLAPDGCNHGLIRPESSLAIVHVSHHAEGSDIDPADQVSFLRAFTDSSVGVRVHVMGAGSTTDCGDAGAGEGFADAVLATGGQTLGLCDADANAHLSRIASAERIAWHRAYTIQLEEGEVSNTVVVTADGLVVLPPTYLYDVPNGTIKLLDMDSLRGKTVEVDYRVREDCEG